MAAPVASTNPYIAPNAAGGGLFCQGEQTGPLNTSNNLTGTALTAFIADMKRWYKHCHSDQSNYVNQTNVSTRGWVWGRGSQGASATTIATKLAAEGIMVSQYRNGSYTSQAVDKTTLPNGTEASLVEQNHPLGILCFWGGNYKTNVHTATSTDATLVTALDATQTTLTVKQVTLSTRPASVPDTWPYRYDVGRVLTSFSTSTANYVPWVRIDDEIMIITAAPTNNGTNLTIQVTRGSFGTVPTAHAVGTKVLSPVYIGSTNASSLDSNLSGVPLRNDVNKPLRYATNVLNAEAHAQLIDRINNTTIMSEGHNSIWLDVSSSFQYNQADGWGNPLRGFDPNTQLKIDEVSWGRGQRKKAHALRRAFPGRTLIGNNFADVINASQNHLIDAVYDISSLENFMLHDVTADLLINNWVNELDLLMRTMASNLGVLAWIRWNQVVDMPADQYKRFAYACFLLCYRSSATKAQVGGPWGPVAPEALFFFDLGRPVGSPTSVVQLADPDTAVGADGLRLHVRHFANGMVIVNPNKTGVSISLTLPPNQTWWSIALNGTATQVTSVTVPPLDAAYCLIDTTQSRVISGAPIKVVSLDQLIIQDPFVVPGTSLGFGTSTVALAGGGPTQTVTQSKFTEPVTQSEFQGTWVLQQTDNQTQLNSWTAEINAALDVPNVVGFSQRVPWSAIDTNFNLIDNGRALVTNWNNAHPTRTPKKYMLRFICGKHVPARVFNEGAYFYYLTSAQTYSANTTYTNPQGVTTNNSKVPKPFNDAGVAGNPVFEANYDDLLSRLTAWCRANDCRMLHTSWYGRLYAEVDAAAETIGSAPGWSQAAWLAGHHKLIDIAYSYGSGSGRDDLANEWAMSGYDSAYKGAQGALVQYLIQKWGNWNPRVWVQANVIGLYPGANPAGSSPIFGAMQMFGVEDFDWDGTATPTYPDDDVYPLLYKYKSSYLEVYTPSFRLSQPNQAALRAEITKFAQRKE